MLEGVPISECTSKCEKWNPKDASAGERFKYIDISSVDRSTKTINSVATIACDDAPSRARQLIRAGDILVSTVRPNLNGVAQVPPDFDGATASTGYCVLRPRLDRVDQNYLFHWVKTDSFVSEMTRRSTGANYPAVTDRVVRESVIPLPPLPEQRRIAAILDKADALRQKRRAAIAKLDQLLQSVFLEMFGDPVSNPKKWPIELLGSICKNEDSRRQPVKKADRESRSGPYDYYGASGVIDDFDDYIFDGERLLIGEDGANLLARSAPIAFIARGKYWVNNHAHVLAENGSADLRYVEYVFENIDLSAYVTGTAQPKLNRANLDCVNIPFPPISLQKRFRAACERIERQKTASIAAEGRLTQLFGTCQQRAFTGQL